ncbi:sodium-type flagellar motor component [Catenovulum agarivorans DS-2]|uniref:Sodium-type flagellar motor component n=1 Tax=Catenovulum agarivorans DS-2 TaxID=1328313 RepID=W7R1G9_9ALTE|nr:tetratricopeptide repeat protein [Catenovulum agarivorans]EWH11480.1 sodium-type flagellar motor component [Catenovulum agarivorans DS-2]
MANNNSTLKQTSVAVCAFATLFSLFTTANSQANEFDNLKVVQIYSQEELIGWINNNTHLTRVKEDRCQLVEDIEARAQIVKTPAYQFLWGDMLAWGVCVDKNPELGLYYMQQAAHQGLPGALEQLGRYYANGILVQQDDKRAINYLREAAALGHIKARVQFAEYLDQGLGSPLDFEDAYHWLHNTVIADKKMHKRAEKALASLATKMPERLVEKAKRPEQK